MTALWGWIRSIVLLLIVLMGFELLLPRSAFRNYVRLVAGVILVLTVVEPVLDWLGAGLPVLPAAVLSGAAPGRLAGVPEGGAGRVPVDRLERVVGEQIGEAFRRQLEQTVRELALRWGVADASAEVALGEDGFTVARVRLLVTPPGGEPGPSWYEGLRDRVASELGLPRGAVVVGRDGLAVGK